jgi:hypothetical protein
MLTDVTINNGFGKITKYLQPGTSIAAVLDFVESHLPEFAQKYGYIENEKNLTSQLISLLGLYTHKSSCLFRFVKDDPQNLMNGNSPTVDIAVQSNQLEGVTIETKHYQNDESCFSFEAKRLSSKVGKTREKEYLIGRFDGNRKYIDSGGVERFKKGIHGSKLEFSGIIGYVQENDYSYWHSMINSWIDELVPGSSTSTVNWIEEDKLVEENVSITARYRSKNSRVGIGNIVLFHIWIYTVNK